MNNRRKIVIIALVLFVGISGLLLRSYVVSNAERVKIRARYEQMPKALSANDTNAAVLLFAPEYRARATDHLGRLTTFARPLGPRSRISFRGSLAEICPERLYPMIPIINAGHTVVMIKVDGEWYSTGKVYVW